MSNDRKIPRSLSLTEMEMDLIKDLDPSGLTHYVREKIREDMAKKAPSSSFSNEYARHTSALASAILVVSIGIAFALIGYFLFLVFFEPYFLVFFGIGIAFCVVGVVMTYRFKKQVNIHINVEK